MAKTNNDAISVLKKDHAAVDQLFRKFERTHGAAEKKRIADRIVREVSIHAAIEEQLVYPQLRNRLDGGQAPVLVALEEHHLAKVTLAEIESFPEQNERYDAKVHVAAEIIRRHVQEEERTLFPALRRMFTPEELVEMGEALGRLKETAPTRPHPAAPDEPPANALVTPAAAVLDRSRDAVNRRLEQVLERGRGVVAQALRRGEDAARRARNRLGRRLERAGREVRPNAH